VGILAARLREVLDVNVTREVGQIGVPILYLAASQDLLVRGVSVRLIQRYAQSVRLITLDAPHLLLQVASAEAAHEIFEFAAHAIAF